MSRARLASRLALWAFIGLVGLIILGGLTLVLFAKDLPRPDKVVRQEGFATKIYDRNNELLYDVFADQRRNPVDLAEIPLYLRQATVAIEDKNFYKHGGFDQMGIFRAVYNIIVRHQLQGGSTLTQQLVKNVLLTSERTLPRKIKEFILAVQIENRWSKDQILQMYLNEAPYGGTTWGVETAAEVYFGKKVSELNLIESAILAGLPQRPSVYSPFSDTPTAYVSRTKEVLRRMREDGYITADQEKEAVAQVASVEFATSSGILKAPHFVMYVRKLLEDRFGQQLVEQGGLRVYTSLDLSLQEEAQKIVTEEIAKVEKIHITNGAAIVADPANGQILAMVGSKNYDDPNYDGKFNVTLAARQPGSAIKPVTYVTALQKGYTLATLLMDSPTTFPGAAGIPDYKPVNYDGKWHGPMQARFALGNSINMPAVKLLAMVGIKDMLATAFDMGLTTLEPTTENLRRFGLSVTLGGGEIRLLEMASAYSAFANGGLRQEPVAILKVTDKSDKVLYEYKPGPARRVLTPEQSFLISHTLADNTARLITFGERSSLNIPDRMVAAKTGTTNNRLDNWTIGWTPQIITGVWVGNNDNSQMKELASGISGAAPIWRRIIMVALKDKPNGSFTAPEGIVTADVDTISGYRAHDGFPSRTEYFVKGTEPTSPDVIHTKLKLCRGQNKLATPARVARGEYDESEFVVLRETDVFSTDNINRWQQGIDEWLTTQGDPRYHPPTDYCGSTEDMAIVINEPANESQINSNEVRVIGKVVAANEMEKIEFIINGELKETVQNSKKFEKIFTLNNGTYTIKIKVRDVNGNQDEREIKIGVNVPWNWQPSPTPAPTSTPTTIPTSTPAPSPTP